MTASPGSSPTSPGSTRSSTTSSPTARRARRHAACACRCTAGGSAAWVVAVDPPIGPSASTGCGRLPRSARWARRRSSSSWPAGRRCAGASAACGRSSSRRARRRTSPGCRRRDARAPGPRRRTPAPPAAGRRRRDAAAPRRATTSCRCCWPRPASARRSSSCRPSTGHGWRPSGCAAPGLTVALVPEEWAAAAGGVDVVIGARAAAWAPCPDLAAVVVLDEHDEALQEERSPTWHARDVVVERARRAGVPVLLVSPCPTVNGLAAVGDRLVPARRSTRSAPGGRSSRSSTAAATSRGRRSLVTSPLIAPPARPRAHAWCASTTRRAGRGSWPAAAAATLARCARCDAAVGDGRRRHAAVPALWRRSARRCACTCGAVGVRQPAARRRPGCARSSRPRPAGRSSR